MELPCAVRRLVGTVTVTAQGSAPGHDTTNARWVLLLGHQRILPTGHQRVLSHGHGHAGVARMGSTATQHTAQRTGRATDALITRLGGSKRLLIAGGLLALCVAGGGASTALLTGGASSVTLHGAMMINPASDNEFGDNFSTVGGTCTGSGGYDDLSQGASVTIHDPTGKVIATGALQEGHGVDGIGCLFNWRITNVPREKFYGVEISHRGTVDFKATGIKSGFDTDIGD